jgi:APA family basic amino acid/polyamine antiporter
MNPMFLKKSIESVRQEADQTGLRKSLGPVQLVLLGIGCIVGAGVYVMTGTAAANYAGPAVVLSFVLAGIACALVGLCYAELSSVLPVSGASYTYAYAAMGEVFAWVLGWMLMFEFGLAGAALAVGFSGYLVSLLGDFGVSFPEWMVTPTLQSQMIDGESRLVQTGSVNLLACFSLIFVAAILSRGVQHSSLVNTVLVFIKIGVLLAFVLAGAGHVTPENWTPFIPENQGGFHYGTEGVIRAASILFFAYLGFEAVATAASESTHPARDVPVGIIGALAIATALYAAVAIVMTGLVPYTELNVADPVAVAVSVIGEPVWMLIIKAGALTGLGSVLLVNTYAQSRVAFAMSRDGLMPRVFSELHARFSTPVKGTFLIAAISGVAAATLPISLLGDLVSLGTAIVFATVAISVIWLRNARPELERPFRVPFGGVRFGGVWIGVIPVLALAACLAMSAPVAIDITLKCLRGNWVPAAIVGAYLLLGVAVYALYGARHSKLRQAAL